MLSALLLTVLAQTPQSVTVTQSRIPRTYSVFSLELSEWKQDRAMVEQYRETFGDKLLMAGSIAPGGATLTVLMQANQDLSSPATWRDRLAPPGEAFELSFAACVDASGEPAPGLGLMQSNYHAYVATRTHVFDVHVSRLSEEGEAPFPRAEFERIVESLRLRLLRRGWAESYPDELAAPMTMAAIMGVESEAWRERYLVDHKDEWAAHFTNAEHLRLTESKPRKKLAAYKKAQELLSKVEKPDTKHRFASAILLEGESLVHYGAKRYEDSIEPLEKGLAILVELGSAVRAPLAYNLACCHALLKHRKPAVEALALAIEVDPRYRAKAAKDSDFDAIREYRGLEELFEEPGTEPGSVRD